MNRVQCNSCGSERYEERRTEYLYPPLFTQIEPVASVGPAAASGRRRVVSKARVRRYGASIGHPRDPGVVSQSTGGAHRCRTPVLATT